MNAKVGSEAPSVSQIELKLEEIEAGKESRAELLSFARALLSRHARDAAELLGETGLAAMVGQTFAFVSERPRREPKLAVQPVAKEVLRPPSYSALLILNDDMPFLVDSVMAELHARGLAVRLVLHPILKLRRDSSGRLETILAEGSPESVSGRKESLILALLDTLDEGSIADLLQGLRTVLAEVRAAVEDWRPMLARLDRAIEALERNPGTIASDLNRETIAFCRWLRDGEFTFLGMREYRLVGERDLADLQVIDGSGLGLLRNPDVKVLRRAGERVHMTPEVRRFFYAPSPIIITKSNMVSRVHRRVHMDYIGLKTYAADGELTGELRIVGLFTSKAYTEPPQQIPFLRLKVEAVVSEAGYPPDSHDGKALLHVLETFPRDELFQIGVRQLSDWTAQILDLELRPRTLVLARVDRFDRFVSVLVYVPRDRFSTSARERIGRVLAESFHGRVSAFQPSFTAAPLVRVHFIIGRTEGPTPSVTQAELEAHVEAAIRTWDDELAEALAKSPAASHLAKYRNAFSAGYAEMFPVSRALEDIDRIERLGPDRPVAIDFYAEPGASPSVVRAAIYRFDQPMPLSERVPVLENLGFRVIDERSYRVHPEGPGGKRQVALHDMVLEDDQGIPVDLGSHRERLEECFLAVLRGDADNDPFNRLIMAAGANWREAAALRAYAAYLRQLRAPFGPRYIAETLARHGGLARDLIELFRVRFDPAVVGDREAQEALVRQRFTSALERVVSLDEDRILRQLFNLVTATVRTNFFQIEGDSARRPLAFKIASRELDCVPAPKPYREIWVFSPRLEGVHLRFAAIARGGLRWSDRAQDFRTEVLGLAKAQQVKNAVIVPAGAKGGFVPKQLPRGARDEIQKEGTSAYRLFVSSLLDLTDNLVDGQVVPPARVVRHDGDDPYLVVAADKGTAAFSDLANGISAEHEFWLGDAFASGGSAGYDHKKMGITARGAWECVKRHFREMDRDIQREPFTVIGVGDMSGDVFGNGMLLSRQIRLLAAFDHRDIFIDPDPDPAASFAERKRLFELGRSSWQDYDKRLISKGGGTFSRSAKSIPLSQEMRRVLGIDATALTPAELISAVLRAPVDLLWFGGIGTYVRASSESHEQVGDRANDGVRITAAELRAKVIGEGANLAMTQKARIEYAQLGGRLNTDFIDNSAGVNSSDQEVNIKIALQPALRSGRLDQAARNRLLADMTEDVARACLENNYRQSLALTLAERAGAEGLESLKSLMRDLESREVIERKSDALPSDAELKARRMAGSGLTRPELAVLMSSAKISIYHRLLEVAALALEELQDVLMSYFPAAMHAPFKEDILGHPLRREIIATELTNDIVNRCGPAFVTDLEDLIGCDLAGVAVAFIAASRSFDFSSLWNDIDALDNALPSRVQLGLYELVQAGLRLRTAWFARHAVTVHELPATIAMHRRVWTALARAVPGVLTPQRADRWSGRMEGLSADGVPAALARAVACLEVLEESSDVALLMQELDIDDPAPVASALFGLGDHLNLAALRRTARALVLSDRFDRIARMDAIAAIEAGQRALTRDLLSSSGGSGAPEIGRWLEQKGAAAVDIRRALAEIVATEELTVSRLTVAAKLVRELAGS